MALGRVYVLISSAISFLSSAKTLKLVDRVALTKCLSKRSCLSLVPG